MGVKLEIAGIEYDVLDYSVTEEATPLSIDDTAQSTGTMSASIRLPEVYSDARKLKYEFESNPILRPIATVDQISYSSEEYSVTGTAEGVRIDRIAEGTSPFRYAYPEPLDEQPWILMRGECSAVIYADRLPPYAPDSTSDQLPFTLDDPVVYFIFRPPTEDSLYPFVGVTGFTLDNVGDWIEFARRSPRRDTLTGNSSDERSPVRSVTSRWLNGENVSPTVSTWTYETAQSDLVYQVNFSSLKGSKYRLVDSQKGVTTGVISDVDFSEEGVTVSGVSDLDQLNSYNVRALPTNLSDYLGFDGTLGEAVRYYANLSGVNYIWVHPDVENIPVSYPGWVGETWFHLKQLAGVHGCEISFVAGFPVFRPIRGRTTEPGRWISKNVSVNPPRLAISVEADNLNIRDIRNELVVSPDMGDGTVLSAEPGEIAEFTLQLSASVYRLTSLLASFTRENGQSVSWGTAGASVRINPEDSQELLVTLSPPANLLTERIYMGYLWRGVRVPSLQVRADGVAFTPERMSYLTGIPQKETGTPVGATLESPFLVDSTTTGSALTRTSHNFSATQFTLTGSVTNVNRRGDDGIPDFISYGEAQTYLEGRLGDGFTYGVLNEFSETLERGNTYGDLQAQFSLEDSTDYAFQEFGNVAGSRIWDPDTRRWYRIRSATITPFNIESIQAEDDLLMGEFLEPWESANMTYGDVQSGLPVGGPDTSALLQGTTKISYGDLQGMGVPNV